MSSGAELLAAARSGDIDDINDLCAINPLEYINYQDECSGNSALHMACANGHLDCVKALMAKGARHLANANGNTPLRTYNHTS